MKTKKLLPLLLVAPLLASCGGSGDSIRSVEFATYSNKVEYTNWYTAFVAESAKTFLNTEGELANATLTQFQDVKTTENVKRKDSEIASSSEFQKGDITGGYDKTNKTLIMNSKQVQDISSKSTSGEYSGSETDTIEVLYEITNLKDESDNTTKLHFVLVDQNTSSYLVLGNYEEETLVKELDSAAKYLFGSLINSVTMKNSYATYIALSDEEKAHFSFYQDAKVFTVTYSAEVDDKDDKVATSHSKKEEVYQVSFSDSSVKVSHKYNLDATATFIKNGNYSSSLVNVSGLKDDVYTMKYETSEQVEVKLDASFTQAAVDVTTFTKAS